MILDLDAPATRSIYRVDAPRATIAGQVADALMTLPPFLFALVIELGTMTLVAVAGAVLWTVLS